jgi:acyl-CoA synthetase (AMP-forming)/AMP-acid ligase II
VADTLFEQFAAAGAVDPDRPFLCYPSSPGRRFVPEGHEWTYGQAAVLVDDLVQRYSAAGYRPGHRVAIVLGSRPEHFWHLLALNRCGVTAVPLNPEYLENEFAFGIGFARSALVLSTDPWITTVRSAVAGLEGTISVLDVTALPAELPRPAQSADDGEADRSPLERTALIIYTSGSTGLPKGCLIPNESVLAAGESYATAGGAMEFRVGADRIYNPLPAFHMNVSVYTLSVVTRLRNCLITAERFSASRWWPDLAQTRATSFHYLGIIPPLLLKAPPGPHDRTHSVRFGNGAGVDPTVQRQFEERFGVPLVESWGMTETSRSIQNTALPRTLEAHAFGKPRYPWEVRIVDDRDQPQPSDTPGELLVRASGPNPRAGFFSGYLNQPEETEHAWRGGWFHTGDICRQRADGMLFFVDRLKNIIRRSGENLAAVEIEQRVEEVAGVDGTAVLAVEDEFHDEEVLACIVLRPGEAPTRETALRILHDLEPKLSVAKLPAWISFVDRIPVTGTQKVQRGQIVAPGADPRADPRTFDLRGAKRAVRRRA